MTKKVNPLDRAWLAGVFEARGYFPRSGYVMRMESVDEQMLKRFHEKAQIGSLTKRQKEGVIRPIWIYQTYTMDDCRELILLISPFLHGTKLKQAGDIVGKIERNELWRKRNPEKAISSLLVNPAPTVGQKTTQH